MMYNLYLFLLQSPVVGNVSSLIELGAVIFGLGAGWQQLRDLNRRVGRIENKLFNGDEH